MLLLLLWSGELYVVDRAIAVVAEMVVNIRDGAVVSHDVVLLPKLVTVRPPTERPPTEQQSSSPLAPSVATSDMHQYSNKVIRRLDAIWCEMFNVH